MRNPRLILHKRQYSIRRASSGPGARAFKGENVWLLRSRWGIPAVKINGVEKNPMRLARR